MALLTRTGVVCAPARRVAAVAEKPVFADSDFGTHLAVAVLPDITVGDLKKKLEKEHAICFPSLGKIEVHALMVKRKCQRYHLPDSMPIWNAFCGLRISWFLFMDISPVMGTWRQPAGWMHMQVCKRKKCPGEEESFELSSDFSHDFDEGRLGSAEYMREGCSGTSPEMGNGLKEVASCATFSGEISVTGIISRYFSDLDEVISHYPSAEYSNVDKVDKVEKTCTGTRSVSSTVPPFNMDGTCLRKHDDSLGINSIEREMVISEAPGMCRDGIKHFLIPASAGGCWNSKIECIEMLEDNETAYRNLPCHISQPSSCLVPSLDLRVKTSKRLHRSGIGKRLLVAANKLVLSSGKKKSQYSKFAYAGGKLSARHLTSPRKIRNFDFSDGDG